MNAFEQLIGRRILKILRIDWKEDYEMNHTLALLFHFDTDSGLLVGIDFEHDTTMANYGTLDDMRNEFEKPYGDPHLNDLKPGDNLSNLVGQNIKSIKVGQFIQDKYSADSFIVKTEHFAGVIIEAGDQKLTLYTADKGQEILFNSNLLFPNPSTWMLT